MQENRVDTAELLEAWRDAIRAAELAERLAKLAAHTVDQADLNADSAEDVAALAEQAAQSAAAAAQRARECADRAREVARLSRADGLRDADVQQVATRALEVEANAAYHDAESAARARHDETPSA